MSLYSTVSYLGIARFPPRETKCDYMIRVEVLKFLQESGGPLSSVIAIEVPKKIKSPRCITVEDK